MKGSGDIFIINTDPKKNKEGKERRGGQWRGDDEYAAK